MQSVINTFHVNSQYAQLSVTDPGKAAAALQNVKVMKCATALSGETDRKRELLFGLSA